MRKKYFWTEEENQILINNSNTLSYKMIQERFFPNIPLYVIKQHASKKLKIVKKRFKLYQKFINCAICDKEIFITNSNESKRKTCSYKCLYEYRRIQDPLEWFLRSKVYRVRSNANGRKIKFKLNWKDLLEVYNKQNGLCYYTGIKMEITYNKKDYKSCSPFLLSIDRIDSNKPYVKNNFVLCCYSINNLKGEHKEEVLKRFFKAIYNNKGEIFNEIKS